MKQNNKKHNYKIPSNFWYIKIGNLFYSKKGLVKTINESFKIYKKDDSIDIYNELSKRYSPLNVHVSLEFNNIKENVKTNNNKNHKEKRLEVIRRKNRASTENNDNNNNDNNKNTAL